MADQNYTPGKMDISEQERTFAGFLRWLKNGIIVIFVVLIFIALVNA